MVVRLSEVLKKLKRFSSINSTKFVLRCLRGGEVFGADGAVVSGSFIGSLRGTEKA